MCRFSVVGVRCLSTRSCGRRPKSANERNRGNGYVGTPRALRRIEPRAKPGNRGHMARKRVQLRRDGMSIAIWGKYLLGPLRFQRIRRGKKDTRDNLHAMSLHLALGNDNHKAPPILDRGNFNKPRQSSTETVFRRPSSDQNLSFVVDVARERRSP